MPRPHDTTSSTPRRASAIIALAVTAIVVVGYVVVSASFTTPGSPLRPAVSDAFAPYFSQRWNVFAPNVLKVNRSLEVQVQWREGGELVHSGWIPVTDIEFAAVRGIPTPSRISKNSFNATQTYVQRYADLSEDQQIRARDTFIEATDAGGFQPIPDAELIDELDALGDDRDDVIRFLRYDYMMTRFAAAFGAAYFGEEIERVRWRAVVEKPNDFLHRFDQDPQFDDRVTTFGWRQPAVETPADAQDVFDDVVERYSGR